MHVGHLRSVVAGLALASAGVAVAQAQRSPDAAVRALVARFDAARLAHDPVALAATLAPDYEEISPIGDVDSRADVVGFYAPASKKPAPAMTDDEQIVRVVRDTAVMTARKSFAMPGAAIRSIRVRYVARRTGAAGWLLVSTQYTPIPPARAH